MKKLIKAIKTIATVVILGPVAALTVSIYYVIDRKKCVSEMKAIVKNAKAKTKRAK